MSTNRNHACNGADVSLDEERTLGSGAWLALLIFTRREVHSKGWSCPGFADGLTLGNSLL